MMAGATVLYLQSADDDRMHDTRLTFVFNSVVDGICGMAWDELDSDDVMRVAKAYYYFSIQFRENLEIACARHPDDAKLAELYDGECMTANLSPWPGVAAPGERMNHDEFMRRLLDFHPAGGDDRLTDAGLTYLARTRNIDDAARAASIASYEDGGLSRVFGAMLRAPHWYGRGQRAFRFFLEEHIRFDSEDGAGHGSLSRHLTVDDGILPLWVAFRDLLTITVPKLATAAAVTRRLPRVPVFLRPLSAV
jgi:hypothetical protein